MQTNAAVSAPGSTDMSDSPTEVSPTGRKQIEVLSSAAAAVEFSELAQQAARMFWDTVPPAAVSPAPDLQAAMGRLWDALADLDSQVGPWSLEPAGLMSSWRIRPEVLSAHSKAWQATRPDSRTNPAWRQEMRLMVALLNGQVVSALPTDLDDQLGAEWGAWLRRQRADRHLTITMPAPGKKKAPAPKPKNASAL
jgi:hypothetical protein